MRYFWVGGFNVQYFKLTRWGRAHCSGVLALTIVPRVTLDEKTDCETKCTESVQDTQPARFGSMRTSRDWYWAQVRRTTFNVASPHNAGGVGHQTL